MRIVDEFDAGFGWIEDGRLARTSHALVDDGKVWLVDALEPDEDVSRALSARGEVAGVIQLLDRHSRDCARLAERFAATHHVAYSGQADIPFELVPIVGRRRWREVALWWRERGVLVCADALGTIRYFLAPRDRLGVHPFLRLVPPRQLASLEPERILVGHGEGLHDHASAALRDALSTARRRAPGTLMAAIRGPKKAAGRTGMCNG